jgi:hypothetical protein
MRTGSVLLAAVASLGLALLAAGCSAASGGTTNCVPTPVGCGGETTIDKCANNDAHGICVGVAYKVGSQSFACASCVDCQQAMSQAAQACARAMSAGDGGGADAGHDAGEAGDAGGDGRADSGGPEAGGKTTCSSAQPCGARSEVTYEQCTTVAPSGSCTEMVYKTSDGHDFMCAGCGDCSSADKELSDYCSNTNPQPVTTCSADASCGGTTLTYHTCTTSIAGSCSSVQYVVSDGTSYPCASCSDCTGAYSETTSYCQSKEPPSTSCSTSYACGSLGETYELCTTSTGGTCDSMSYKTSGGHSWLCASCNDCQTAYSDVSSYCASQGVPTTTCSTSTSCSSGVTYELCTTSTAGTCDSMAYRTSDGQSWSCAGCSDCTTAYLEVLSYCDLLGSTCGTQTCSSGELCCDCSGTEECLSDGGGIYDCTSYGCL